MENDVLQRSRALWHEHVVSAIFGVMILDSKMKDKYVDGNKCSESRVSSSKVDIETVIIGSSLCMSLLFDALRFSKRSVRPARQRIQLNSDLRFEHDSLTINIAHITMANDASTITNSISDTDHNQLSSITKMCKHCRILETLTLHPYSRRPTKSDSWQLQQYRIVLDTVENRDFVVISTHTLSCNFCHGCFFKFWNTPEGKTFDRHGRRNFYMITDFGNIATPGTRLPLCRLSWTSSDLYGTGAHHTQQIIKQSHTYHETPSTLPSALPLSSFAKYRQREWSISKDPPCREVCLEFSDPKARLFARIQDAHEKHLGDARTVTLSGVTHAACVFSSGPKKGAVSAWA